MYKKRMYKKRTYKKRTDPYLPSLCVKENLTFVPPSISSIYCFTNSFYLVTGLPMKRTAITQTANYPETFGTGP